MSEAETASPPSATSTDSRASPFGAARPIDTFAKEKEIEEKRQLALRQKKEHEEKVREEKRVAKEAAREAAKAEKTAASAQAGGKEEENGTPAPQSGSNYEILSKGAAGDENGTADDEAEAEGNGIVVEDKAVKPKEITRDVRKTSEGWRGKADDKTEASTEALEEDGWSTVAKPKNNRRGGGNQGARAIAS